MKKFLHWIEGKSPTILTILGCAGVVATAALTARAVREADAREDDFRAIHPDREMELKEVVRYLILPYVPPAACALATVACVLGANALNKRQQAALMSAYALLEQSYREYREKVRAIAGPGTDEFVEKAVEREREDRENREIPWDEVQTFYLSKYGKFFDRTMNQIWQAEYHLNRNFVLRGYVTFNEFLDFLDLEHIEGGDKIGWDAASGEMLYGYSWIDFSHRRYVADDGLRICEIYLDFEPHELFCDLSYVPPTFQTLKD